MEPRKDELKKVPQTRMEVRKNRFRIVKLEERIAPRCHSNRAGTRYWGNCK